MVQLVGLNLIHHPPTWEFAMSLYHARPSPFSHPSPPTLLQAKVENGKKGEKGKRGKREKGKQEKKGEKEKKREKWRRHHHTLLFVMNSLLSALCFALNLGEHVQLTKDIDGHLLPWLLCDLAMQMQCNAMPCHAMQLCDVVFMQGARGHAGLQLHRSGL